MSGKAFRNSGGLCSRINSSCLDPGLWYGDGFTIYRTCRFVTKSKPFPAWSSRPLFQFYTDLGGEGPWLRTSTWLLLNEFNGYKSNPWFISIIPLGWETRTSLWGANHHVLARECWRRNASWGHSIKGTMGEGQKSHCPLLSHIDLCPFNSSNCYSSIVGRHPDMFLDISVFDCFNGSQTPYTQQHVV